MQIMDSVYKKNGFSLIEVLLAVGTLAIGMIFIGGTFFTGIYFSTLATERTIAAVVTDEAFAKIRLYGIDPNQSALTVDNLVLFENINSDVDADEYAYPSIKTSTEKQYYWSALCRRVDSDENNRLVQVTVFVSRKMGLRVTYPGDAERPTPVEVEISTVAGSGNENRLIITLADEQKYINDGCTIADNQTGQLYRVIERLADSPDTIVLDRAWQGEATGSVWVVPPPVNGGRNPCIAVYQRVVRF